MGFHMKTTLEIDEGVMRRLKERAAAEDTTMSALVEAALRAFLDPRAAPRQVLPPLPSFDGGELLVDIDNAAALRDLLDEWDAEDGAREREARAKRERSGPGAAPDEDDDARR